MRTEHRHTRGGEEKFIQFLRIHHRHYTTVMQPLITAASEPYGLGDDLPEMSVEILRDPRGGYPSGVQEVKQSGF